MKARCRWIVERRPDGSARQCGRRARPKTIYCDGHCERAELYGMPLDRVPDAA
jgi:hypothetical protein